MSSKLLTKFIPLKNPPKLSSTFKPEKITTPNLLKTVDKLISIKKMLSQPNPSEF